MLNVLRKSIATRDRDLFDSIRGRQWRAVAEAMRVEAATLEEATLFHSRWTEHGERIRDGVGDDCLLAAALRSWLPPYSGEAVMLYRGESAERISARRLGFCWSPKRDVAEMFARGWHAIRPGGGQLIRSFVSAEAILAEPNAHSRHLGEDEYTIDPSRLASFETLESYPQVE